MIRIIAQRPDGTASYQLDVNQNSRIKLNFQNIEPPEVQLRKSSYSQAFSLPFSERNNQFFGHYYQTNLVDGDFDPSKKAPVQLYSDGILIFEGALRLLKVSVTNQAYQVSINAIEKDIFLEMGQAKLSDLFEVASPYDYFPTGENFRDANQDLDITIGEVGANIVTIPLCDYGTHDGGRLYWNQNGIGMANDNHVRPEQMKPAFKIRELLDLVMAQTSYTLEDSGILEDEALDKLYMLLNTESETLPIRPFTGWKVGIESDYQITQSFTTIPFNVQTGDYFYDPEDQVGGNGVFTSNADFTGILTFSADIDYSNAANVQQELNFRVLKNGVVAYTDNVFLQPPGTYATDVVWNVTSNIFEVNAGDVMVIQVRRNGGFGNLPVIKAHDATASRGYWTLYSYDVALSTEPVSIKGCMPDMLQADFLKDLLIRFNGQLVPTADANVLKIESVRGLSSEVKDWTSYLDVDSPIEIIPPSAFRTRYFTLKDKQNNTWGSQYAQQALGIDMGEYRFDSGDEWADGDQAYEGPYGVYQMGHIPDLYGGSEIASQPIPMLYAQDGEGNAKGTTFPPILLFKIAPLHNTATFKMGTTSVNKLQRYGLYDDYYPGTGELSVQWAHQWQSPDFGIPYAGIGGWVRSYWLETLNELYNANSKMVTCGLYLSPRDIQDFSFNDQIQIAGDRYRVISITGYDASKPSIAQAKLLRLGQPVSVNVLFPNGEDVCNATPANQNPDGTVNWAWNESGTLAEDVCCEEWGYFWDGEDCLWNVQQMPATGGRTTSFLPTRDGQAFNRLTLDRLFKNFHKATDAGFPVASNGLVYDMNRESISLQSRFMRFSMSATTTGTTQAIAERNDLDIGGFVIRPEMACRLEVNAIGVYVTGKRTFGSTAYIQHVATVKNVGGTLEVVDDTEQANQRDSNLGAPSIAVITGTKSLGSTDAVQLGITGESDTHILWSLDVFASFISFQGFGVDDTLMIQESTEPLETENGTFLSTEE